MSRLSELDPNAMAAEQRKVFDQIASGPRGRVRGPLAAWLHSPKFASCVHPTGEFLRYSSLLSGHVAELAILVVSKFWGASFIWFVHEPLALKVDISKSVIDAIANDETPEFETENDRVTWQLVTDLLHRRPVSQELYDSAKAFLGEAGLVELSGLVGYYSLGSFTLNLFEISAPR